jgi:hypothetical protein
MVFFSSKVIRADWRSRKSCLIRRDQGTNSVVRSEHLDAGVVVVVIVVIRFRHVYLLRPFGRASHRSH